MKKKVVIIVAAVMAVVAIVFGIALGLNLGVERSLNFESKNSYSFNGASDFDVEIVRVDKMKELKQPGGVYDDSYGKGFFITKSIIFVEIEYYDSSYRYEVKDVHKKGDELKIHIECGYQISSFCTGMTWRAHIDLSKWDLIGAKNIEIIFEGKANNEE